MLWIQQECPSCVLRLLAVLRHEPVADAHGERGMIEVEQRRHCIDVPTIESFSNRAQGGSKPRCQYRRRQSYN